MSKKFKDVGFVNIPNFINSQSFNSDQKLVLSTIYSYSQNGMGAFYGSYKYLASIIGKTRRTTITLINGLLEMNLIVKIGDGRTEKNKFVVNELSFEYLKECTRIMEFIDVEILKKGDDFIYNELCEDKFRKTSIEIHSTDENSELRKISPMKKFHTTHEKISCPSYTNTNTNSIYNKKGEKIEKETATKKGKIKADIDNDIQDGPEYKSFVLFNKWVKENAPSVSKMAMPFTFDQYMKITKDNSKEFVMELIINMGNYKPLNSKNVSAYRTFCNWAKRHKDRISKIDSVSKVDNSTWNKYFKK